MGNFALILLIMSKFIIYGLKDPRTGEYRYIGKSCSGLTRPKQHAKYVAQGTSVKNDWIRELKKEGLEYEIDVLEETEKEKLAEREVWWIANYRPFGLLTNLSDGGEYDTGAAGRAAQAKATPEQKAARLAGFRKAQIALSKRTTEERRASALRTPPEVLAARGRAVAALKTFEEHSAHAKRISVERWAKSTPEERREHMKPASEAMTKEEKSKASKEAQARLSPEKRKANSAYMRSKITDEHRVQQGRSHSATIFATTTPEQRKEMAKYANSCIAPENKGAVRKFWASMTPEERKETIRARWAQISPEKRSAQALKAWATRRARAEKKSEEK